MVKKSKALIFRGSGGAISKSQPVIATARDQVTRLQKILLSHARWRKVDKLTTTTLAEAKATLIAVREVHDTAEKGRKALTAPLLAEKKEIDAVYKSVTEVADTFDSYLTHLILDFEKVERAALAAKAEKEARVLEKKGAEQAAADVRAQVALAPIVEGGGVTTQEIWRAEVAAPLELAAAWWRGDVPPDTYTVNMTALHAMARDRKGQNPPPGVKFVCEKIVKRA